MILLCEIFKPYKWWICQWQCFDQSKNQMFPRFYWSIAIVNPRNQIGDKLIINLSLSVIARWLDQRCKWRACKPWMKMSPCCFVAVWWKCVIKYKSAPETQFYSYWSRLWFVFEQRQDLFLNHLSSVPLKLRSLAKLPITVIYLDFFFLI